METEARWQEIQAEYSSLYLYSEPRTLAEALRDYIKNTPNFHGKELEKRNAIAVYFLSCGEFRLWSTP